MLRLSANLSMLFGDLPVLDRFAAARSAGFAAAEMQYPYDHAIGDLSAACREANIPVVLINASRGRLAQDRGLACLPGRETEFRETIAAALDYSAALGNRLVHILSGVPDPECEPREAAALWHTNMSWAADAAARVGVAIVVEALNPHDVPGYFIRSLDEAMALIGSLERENVGLLFDVYHCAKAGEPIAERLHACMPSIRHIQIADSPARGEPGSGDIDWQNVFAAIESSGYRGFVGAEYNPVGGTVEGLAWARPYLQTN